MTSGKCIFGWRSGSSILSHCSITSIPIPRVSGDLFDFGIGHAYGEAMRTPSVEVSSFEYHGDAHCGRHRDADHWRPANFGLNEFDGNDNLLFFPGPPFLDFDGVSFTVDNPSLSDDGFGDVNVYFDPSSGLYTEDAGYPGAAFQ